MLSNNKMVTKVIDNIIDRVNFEIKNNKDIDNSIFNDVKDITSIDVFGKLKHSVYYSLLPFYIIYWYLEDKRWNLVNYDEEEQEEKEAEINKISEKISILLVKCLTKNILNNLDNEINYNALFNDIEFLFDFFNTFKNMINYVGSDLNEVMMNKFIDFKQYIEKLNDIKSPFIRDISINIEYDDDKIFEEFNLYKLNDFTFFEIMFFNLIEA